MGVFPDDEEQRTRRDGLDVVEGVEVHELHVACERGVRGRPVRRPFGRELSARRAVEGVEFPLDRGGVFRQLVCRAAGVCGFSARKLRVALFRRFGQYPLPLLKCQGVFQSAAAGCAHVVHAHRGDGFQPGIDLRRAYGETSAAADSDCADAAALDELPRSEEIRRRAEILGVYLRGDRVARLSLAVAPE